MGIKSGFAESNDSTVCLFGQCSPAHPGLQIPDNLFRSQLHAVGGQVAVDQVELRGRIKVILNAGNDRHAQVGLQVRMERCPGLRGGFRRPGGSADLLAKVTINGSRTPGL